MESFSATLEKELIEPEGREWTRASARQDIFRFIEAYYNSERLHTTLGYLTPIEFEQTYTCGISRRRVH